MIIEISIIAASIFDVHLKRISASFKDIFMDWNSVHLASYLNLGLRLIKTYTNMSQMKIGLLIHR